MEVSQSLQKRMFDNLWHCASLFKYKALGCLLLYLPFVSWQNITWTDKFCLSFHRHLAGFSLNEASLEIGWPEVPVETGQYHGFLSCLKMVRLVSLMRDSLRFLEHETVRLVESQGPQESPSHFISSTIATFVSRRPVLSELPFAKVFVPTPSDFHSFPASEKNEDSSYLFIFKSIYSLRVLLEFGHLFFLFFTSWVTRLSEGWRVGSWVRKQVPPALSNQVPQQLYNWTSPKQRQTQHWWMHIASCTVADFDK